MDESRPTIDMTFPRVLCSRHGEPFRERWPSGYAGWCLMGFERLLLDKSFAEETHGEQSEIGPALDKSPICCRLGNAVVRELFGKIQETFSVVRE